MAPYLRFTPSNPRMIVKPRLAVLVALGLLACGGGSRTPAPQSLPETLAHFMSAVKANDAKRMGTLWGTERGPAAEGMKSDELQQRLSDTPKNLTHAGNTLTPTPPPAPGHDHQPPFHRPIATGLSGSRGSSSST